MALRPSLRGLWGNEPLFTVLVSALKARASTRKQLPHTRTSVLDPLMADTNPFSRKRARTCRPARLARSGEHAAYLLLRRAVVAAAAHRGPANYHAPRASPLAAGCCRLLPTVDSRTRNSVCRMKVTKLEMIPRIRTRTQIRTLQIQVNSALIDARAQNTDTHLRRWFRVFTLTKVGTVHVSVV